MVPIYLNQFREVVIKLFNVFYFKYIFLTVERVLCQRSPPRKGQPNII